MLNSPADVGLRIKYWREKAGKSGQELALAVGVDSSAVYHWEAGRYTPTLENTVKVAEACGVTLPRFWAPWYELALGE